jgi:hypothetical protein
LELIEEIREEVEDGAMPMKAYVLLHPAARLSPEDRTLVRSWTVRSAALELDVSAGP